jgi:hypothetical protein
MLGRRPLAKIGPADLPLLYADRLAAGAPRRASATFIGFCIGYSTKPWWGAASRNPVTIFDPLRVARPEFGTLSPEGARALLSALHVDRPPALYVALTTGMRQGGLSGVAVERPGSARQAPGETRQQLHRNPGGGWTIREPKTERSWRRVLLRPLAVKAPENRLRQNEERLQTGPRGRRTNWVFPTTRVGRSAAGTYPAALPPAAAAAVTAEDPFS